MSDRPKKTHAVRGPARAPLFALCGKLAALVVNVEKASNREKVTCLGCQTKIRKPIDARFYALTPPRPL
jgi:hypothetical protein